MVNAAFDMNTTSLHWARRLTYAVGCGGLAAGALAQDCEYSPPELQGEFYFKGECITNTPDRHYLRTEIGSTLSGSNEVRFAIVYVPPKNPPAPGWPLLLTLHGLHHNAATMEQGHTNLIVAAQERGVVLAFLNGSDAPEGTGRIWYMFRGGPALVDLNYVEGAILWLQHFLPIDPKRTFVSGMSGGACMTQRVAAERPNRVKAGAAFCGGNGMSNTLDGVRYEISTPTAPISMYLVRGGEDPKIPPFGTVNADGHIWDTVAEQLEFWVTAAGGTMDQVTTVLVDMNTTRHTYAGGSTLVEMTFIRNLGHEWPDSYDRPVLEWLLALPADPTIRQDATRAVITYPSGTLQSATNVMGPWLDVPGASSPYSLPALASRRFFRTRLW